MNRRLIVLITFILVYAVNVKSQEKWNLKINVGTVYAMTDALFKENKVYTNNNSWYPGIDFGTSLSYDVFPWLGFETGLNFERIRTGYKIGVLDQPGLVKENYSKNYLKVPLLILLKTSPNFGVIVGSGYRQNLSALKGLEETMEWNELFITGGFFVNIGTIRTSLSYTQGTSEKNQFYFSRNRTISFNISYILCKK